MFNKKIVFFYSSQFVATLYVLVKRYAMKTSDKPNNIVYALTYNFLSENERKHGSMKKLIK